MYNGIVKHIGHAEAETFAHLLPLSKFADNLRKFEWANDVCRYLEETFTEDNICKIRVECSCQPGAKAEKVKSLYERSADYGDFCERFNKEYAPANSVSYDGDALYFSYPTCYCSFVKRGDGDVAPSWCMCTLGYAERLFSHALSREVQVELLESVKTGGQKCVVKIT